MRTVHGKKYKERENVRIQNYRYIEKVRKFREINEKFELKNLDMTKNKINDRKSMEFNFVAKKER